MKKHLATALILVLISCNNKSNDEEFKHAKTDTIRTAINYALDWTRNDLRNSVALKIFKDTFIIDTPKTNSLKWRRDSFYKVPLPTNIFDSVTKKPILDSTGKQMQIIQWYDLPKELLIIDYNKKFN